VNYNANESYGVGFIDGVGSDQQGLGMTGTAQDRYGNVWCNSGGGDPF
jgi:calcium channel MID1